MGTEMWIVIGVIVVLFGGSQLPKLARSVGQASTEFKKGVKLGAEEEAKPAASASPEAPATPPADTP